MKLFFSYSTTILKNLFSAYFFQLQLSKTVRSVHTVRFEKQNWYSLDNCPGENNSLAKTIVSSKISHRSDQETRHGVL